MPVWCLSGSEKTIFVFEVSKLIESELIRASYLPGKARREWWPQGKSRVEEQHILEKERADCYQSGHKSPSAVLFIASWKSWAASSMKRDRNQIPLPDMLPTRERESLFCGTLTVHETITFSSLGKAGGERKSTNVAIYNRPQLLIQAWMGKPLSKALP